MRYKYCPECGQKLHEKEAGDDGKIPFCISCNKYWFDSFVIVLVYNEYNEIVLCRQGYLSDQYTSFTLGYITPGGDRRRSRNLRSENRIPVDIKI